MPKQRGLEIAEAFFAASRNGDMLQTTALEIADGKIVAMYVTRNPDKLRHLNVGERELH